jgi:hypothetical protein
MANKKVYFLEREAMLAKFSEIIKADPPMAKEEGFYFRLASFAGMETNARHLVLALFIALEAVVSGYSVRLGQHVEALVSDAETIKAAKDSLERIALLQQGKPNKKWHGDPV